MSRASFIRKQPILTIVNIMRFSLANVAQVFYLEVSLSDRRLLRWLLERSLDASGPKVTSASLNRWPRKSRRGRSPASCGGRKGPCGRRRSCWELRSARGGIVGGSDSDSQVSGISGWQAADESLSLVFFLNRGLSIGDAVCASGANQRIAPRTLAARSFDIHGNHRQQFSDLGQHLSETRKPAWR